MRIKWNSNFNQFPLHRYRSIIIAAFVNRVGQSLGHGMRFGLHLHSCHILVFVVLISKVLVITLIQNKNPFFLAGYREDCILASRNGLVANLHIFGKLDARGMMRPGNPHFIIRYQTAPDRSAFYAR